MMEFQLIEHKAQLHDFLSSLAGEQCIAIDTEFVRDHSYYPKLCLIQIASSNHNVVIDALATDFEFNRLEAILFDPAITKILHAARQDLEIFFHQFNRRLPTPVFDTQIAAMVCGFGDQCSYEKLVLSLCNQQLDKTSRNTDWTMRPLSERQLRYAAEDVFWLRKIYHKLAAKLEMHGRRSWIADEMAELTNSSRYQQDPNQAWKRLKIRKASPKTLGIACQLAAWRERCAQTANRPRGWIMRDETVRSIAEMKPQTPDALMRVRGFAQSFGARHQDRILQTVQEGLEQPVTLAAQHKKANYEKGCEQKPDPDSLLLLKFLLAIKANSAGVVPRLIANEQALNALACGKINETNLADGWRYELFGRDATAFLAGKLSIRLKNGAAQLCP